MTLAAPNDGPVGPVGPKTEQPLAGSSGGRRGSRPTEPWGGRWFGPPAAHSSDAKGKGKAANSMDAVYERR